MSNINRLVRAEGISALSAERSAVSNKLVTLAEDIDVLTRTYLENLDTLNRQMLAERVKLEILDDSIFKLLDGSVDVKV